MGSTPPSLEYETLTSITTPAPPFSCNTSDGTLLSFFVYTDDDSIIRWNEVHKIEQDELFVFLFGEKNAEDAANFGLHLSTTWPHGNKEVNIGQQYDWILEAG